MRHACARELVAADLGRARRAATMGDVAKLAGVSQQTVSRVVNAANTSVEHARAGAAGDARAELSAQPRRPSARHRPFEHARRHQLDTAAYGPSSVLLGLERAARAHGYVVSVARLADARPRLAAPGARPAPAPARRGHPPQRRARRDHPRARPPGDGRPARRGRGHAGGGVPIVAVDQVAGAAAATRLLLDLGHRTVAHIAGPAGLVVGAQADGGLARGAGVGRGARAAAAVRRLERALGLRARRPAGRRTAS